MFFFAENFLRRAWLFFSCSLAWQIFLFLHFLGSGRAEPWAAPGGPFPEHPGVLKRVPVSGEHRVGADCQPDLVWPSHHPSPAKGGCWAAALGYSPRDGDCCGWAIAWGPRRQRCSVCAFRSAKTSPGQLSRVHDLLVGSL